MSLIFIRKESQKHSSLTKTVGVLLLCVTLISAWTFPQKAEAAATNTFGDGITVQLPDVSLNTIFSDGALINGTIIVKCSFYRFRWRRIYSSK